MNLAKIMLDYFSEEPISLFLSVKRDLENLLNTRQCFLMYSKNYHEIKKSLLNYGIPDFMNMHFDLEESQKHFCQKVAEIIGCYEPRLKEVKVKLINPLQEKDRTLKIRIEGLLQTETASELIVFDSVLKPISF